MATLESLPPEITREIINYLPIRSLLAFGLTCRDNHAIQTAAVCTLQIGIFHSRLSGMVSFIESSPSRDSTYSVPVVLSKGNSRTKEQVLRHQNRIVQAVADRYRHTLRDLEVAIWDIDEATAISLARLRNIRRLSLRLDHPFTRHRDLSKIYWDSAPPSTVWNSLVGLRGKGACFDRLESLNLERAGVTDYQLQRLLERSPRLRELRLQKCTNLTEETFEYLANSDFAKTLEILHFTNTDSEAIDERVLKHLVNMTKLKASQRTRLIHPNLALTRDSLCPSMDVVTLTAP